MAMIPSVVVISILLFGIEELAVNLEETLYISPIQSLCNKIYDNDHKIIGWDTNKVNKNVERET